MSRQWIEVHAGKKHSACICVCVRVFSIIIIIYRNEKELVTKV